MDKLRSFTVAAAVAFALAACAQNETTPDETDSRTTSTSSTTTPADSTSPAESTTPADSSSGSMSQDSSGAAASTDTSMAGSTAPVAIGLKVETATGESLGTVIDIVADATTGAPLFVVISSEGETTAVPYAAANSMVQQDALVMDRSRLESAPRVDQGEWRDPASGDWTSEANGYWGQGEMRTASPEPGASSSEQSAEPQPEPEPRG
ncbi:MAG: PRC-barrel domain-containing protein [Steroidobacteraceae bacterium]